MNKFKFIALVGLATGLVLAGSIFAPVKHSKADTGSFSCPDGTHFQMDVEGDSGCVTNVVAPVDDSTVAPASTGSDTAAAAPAPTTPESCQ